MNEVNGKLYGYIRVSTKEQNEYHQRLAKTNVCFWV